MFEALKYNLKNNRRGVLKQATAWFLFSAIIVVFIFWGLTPHNQQVAQGGVAANVNDTSISLARLSEGVERLRQDPRYEQFQALGGDAGRQLLQQQALSQLVEMELIRQQTDQQRIWTSDAEVREVITSIPQFQEDGRFKRERYMGYLQAVRKTPAEFEDEVRNEQALRRTVRLFSASLRPSPLELEKQSALSEMKANLDFVSVPTESLVIPESVKQADIKAFVADSANQAKVKEYYDSHKDEFSQQESVKARHILIQANAGDAEAEKKALAKIEEIAQKAKTEDFGKLASQFSEDPGSKSKGGVLDFFTRGRMVKEFEDVAFSAPVNEISQPVKTQYGYHLIQVLEKKPASTTSLEEAQDRIAEILIAKDRSKVAIESLQEALRKNDVAAVNKFVAEHKLKWDETGEFSVDADAIPKIGPNDEVARLAFGLSPEKPLADSLVRQGPTAYVVRYKAVASTKGGNKKEEKPEVMNEIVASRRSEDALKLWVDGLRKQAKISTNPEIFARQ